MNEVKIADYPQLAGYLKTLGRRKNLSKKYASALAAYSKMVDDPKRAEQILHRSWRVGVCSNVIRYDPVSHKVVDSKSCGDRFCPICAHAKAMRLYHINKQIIDQDPGKYLLITFTVPNCYPEALRENLNLMKKAYRAWYKSVQFDNRGWLIGGIMGVEVTYNDEMHKRGLPCLHPHFHLLCHVTDKYYQTIIDDLPNGSRFRPYAQLPPGERVRTSYTYLNGSWQITEQVKKTYAQKYKYRETVDKLRRRWMDLIGFPVEDGCPLLQCDITPVDGRGDNTVEGACLEVSKYLVKATAYVYNPYIIGTMMEQMRSLAQYTYCGSWRKLSVALIAKDEEDYNVAKSKIVETSSYLYICYDDGNRSFGLYRSVPGWVETTDDVSQSIRQAKYQRRRRVQWKKQQEDIAHYHRVLGKAAPTRIEPVFEQLKIS